MNFETLRVVAGSSLKADPVTADLGGEKTGLTGYLVKQLPERGAVVLVNGMYQFMHNNIIDQV